MEWVDGLTGIEKHAYAWSPRTVFACPKAGAIVNGTCDPYLIRSTDWLPVWGSAALGKSQGIAHPFEGGVRHRLSLALTIGKDPFQFRSIRHQFTVTGLDGFQC